MPQTIGPSSASITRVTGDLLAYQSRWGVQPNARQVDRSPRAYCRLVSSRAARERMIGAAARQAAEGSEAASAS